MNHMTNDILLPFGCCGPSLSCTQHEAQFDRKKCATLTQNNVYIYYHKISIVLYFESYGFCDGLIVIDVICGNGLLTVTVAALCWIHKSQVAIISKSLFAKLLAS